MKKIVCALTAGALLAAAAFAGDGEISASLHYKQGIDIAKLTFDLDGDDDTKGTFFIPDECNKAQDEMKITVKSDYCGAFIDFYNSISGISHTYTDATQDGSEATGAANYIYSFYGWINYTFDWGTIYGQAGLFDSRFTDLITVDAGEIKLEGKKLGVNNGDVAKDVDNLGSTILVSSWKSGQRMISSYFGGQFSDILPGTISAYAGINKNENAFIVTKDDSGNALITSDASYVFEMTYAQDKFINADVVFRMPAQDVYAFGAYVNPVMIENLNLVAGFSYGYNANTTNSKYVNDGNEWAVDVRARYVFNDKFALITHNNYSSVVQVKAKTERKQIYTAWNLTWYMNDYVRFNGDISYEDTDMTEEFSKGYEFIVMPNFRLAAGKAAAVTTGLKATFTNSALKHEAPDTMVLEVPFVFRVAL